MEKRHKLLQNCCKVHQNAGNEAQNFLGDDPQTPSLMCPPQCSNETYVTGWSVGPQKCPTSRRAQFSPQAGEIRHGGRS
uniref:Uncharacterized protein n=1 Tax=Anguilla anguilla TaxID=7936 RepID=A0A0E9XPD8_ANGAN